MCEVKSYNQRFNSLNVECLSFTIALQRNTPCGERPISAFVFLGGLQSKSPPKANLTFPRGIFLLGYWQKKFLMQLPGKANSLHNEGRPEEEGQCGSIKRSKGEKELVSSYELTSVFNQYDLKLVYNKPVILSSRTLLYLQARGECCRSKSVPSCLTLSPNFHDDDGDGRSHLTWDSEGT